MAKISVSDVPVGYPGRMLVATHIAQGESNLEIAEALVLAERTVESHVTNILHKLGFMSRAQIRKWVLEKGMVKRVE